MSTERDREIQTHGALAVRIRDCIVDFGLRRTEAMVNGPRPIDLDRCPVGFEPIEEAKAIIKIVRAYDRIVGGAT